MADVNNAPSAPTEEAGVKCHTNGLNPITIFFLASLALSTGLTIRESINHGFTQPARFGPVPTLFRPAQQSLKEKENTTMPVLSNVERDLNTIDDIIQSLKTSGLDSNWLTILNKLCSAYSIFALQEDENTTHNCANKILMILRKQKSLLETSSNDNNILMQDIEHFIRALSSYNNKK